MQNVTKDSKYVTNVGHNLIEGGGETRSNRGNFGNAWNLKD